MWLLPYDAYKLSNLFVSNLLVRENWYYLLKHLYRTVVSFISFANLFIWKRLAQVWALYEFIADTLPLYVKGVYFLLNWIIFDEIVNRWFQLLTVN